MKFYKSLFLLLAASLSLTACKKDVIEPFKTTESSASQAFLKVIYSSPYRLNPGVQLKLNDTRVSSNITYSTPFPGGGLNTGGLSFPYYLAINPGQTNIALSVPKIGTNFDSLALYSNSVNLQAGKYYSAFITDTLTNSRMLLLEDDMTPVTGDVSKFRFVNLIPNLPAVDLYYGSTLVAANVAYLTSSPTFTLARGLVDRWYIRPAGAAATTTALAQYPSGTTNTTIPFNKYLTVYARGYNGTTGTDPRVPAISLTYHM